MCRKGGAALCAKLLAQAGSANHAHHFNCVSLSDISLIFEYDFIFECGTATHVRFDGLRGSLHTGVQVQLSTGRRSPKTATSRGRPPQRRNDHDPRTPRKGRLRPGLFIAHGPEVLAALAEPDAPHSRKAAAASERHDLALMQPLLPEPASDEHSLTLAVLDLHCATNVYPELWTLGFLQPSGLRSLPVCLWKVGVLHDSFCSWSRGPGRARGTR